MVRYKKFNLLKKIILLKASHFLCQHVLGIGFFLCFPSFVCCHLYTCSRLYIVHAYMEKQLTKSIGILIRRGFHTRVYFRTGTSKLKKEITFTKDLFVIWLDEIVRNIFAFYWFHFNLWLYVNSIEGLILFIILGKACT